MKLKIKNPYNEFNGVPEVGQIWSDESIGGKPYIITRIITKEYKRRYQLTSLVSGAAYANSCKDIKDVFGGDDEDFVYVGNIQDVRFK